MERRSDRSPQSASRTVVDAKMSLSLWLRAGRANKGLSIEDVAKVTKIQQRILERLEAGKLEGLPAEVFVRGFVRSYARCVGLDEAEALQRYTTAAGQPTAPSASVSARALVESMTELAPSTSIASRAPKILVELTDVAGEATFAGGSLQAMPKAETVTEMLLPETGTLVIEPVRQQRSAVIETVTAEAIEPISESSTSEVVSPVIEVIDVPVSLVEIKPMLDAAPSENRGGQGQKKKRKGKNKRKQIATGTPADPTPVIESRSETPATEEIVVGAESTHVVADVVAEPAALAMDTTETVAEVIEPTETWAPRMPTVTTQSVPWRRPYASTASTVPVVPTMVIDDADPDSAERELEERAAQQEPARRSFLPPILLDREDRSARQGGLTLAVIILLIAATLTLSYLMRRPSSTGDGVTMAPTDLRSPSGPVMHGGAMLDVVG